MVYIIKRILTMTPVSFFLNILVFSLIHLISGDPAQVILGQDATPQSLAILRWKDNLHIH